MNNALGTAIGFVLNDETDSSACTGSDAIEYMERQRQKYRH